MCRELGARTAAAQGIALEESMRIRRSTAGRHRRPARVLPAILALGLAVSALIGAAAAAAATNVSTMHYHGHVHVAPMMHYHG